jgi:hypothetical protein
VPTPVSTGGASAIPAGTTISEITAGFTHTCALDSTGNAYCWGTGGNGQLGNNAINSGSLVPVAVTGTDGLLPSNKMWIQITAGDNFTCALDTSGKAYCWGAGFNGQTGSGSNSQFAHPTVVAVTGATFPTSQLPPGVVLDQIAAGDADACALDSSTGDIYCWGRNTNGQIGSGNTTSSNVPVKVGGLPAPASLSIACPASVDLGSGPPGTTVSAAMTSCTVTSTGVATWVVQASVTIFTNQTTVGPTIPATAASYTVGNLSTTGTGTVTPTPVQLSTTPQTVLSAAGVGSPFTATWNPTITVAVPPSAVGGTYTGTLTESAS